MKKLILAASLFAATFSVNAQDTQTTTTTRTTTSSDGEGFISKNGHQVLPEAGDLSISVDAVPFFELLGNAFNNDADNTIGYNFPNGYPAITGRYFLDAKTAVRAKVRIGLQSSTQRTLEAKTGTTTNELVENEFKTKSSNVLLAVGLEKRRGKHRVQGFYGAELMFMIDSDPNEKNTYGNALSSANQNGGFFRTLEEKNGNTLGVGPRGFIGVDYFIAPKISIGGEFGWALMLTKTGESEVTEERWDGINNVVETRTRQTVAKEGGINLDTDNFGGAINLSFFF